MICPKNSKSLVSISLTKDRIIVAFSLLSFKACIVTPCLNGPLSCEDPLVYPGLIFFFYLSTMVGSSSGRRENLLCPSLSAPATRQYVLGSLAASSTGGCLSGLSPVRILSWYAVLPSLSRLLPVVLEHVIGHWVLKQLVEDH